MLRELFNSSLFQLSSVNRYSGVYLSRSENVAEHTTAVGLIAIYIGNLISNIGVEVSIEKIALKSLVHDVEESLICDIPRPVKYYNSQSEDLFDDMADNSVKSLSGQIDFERLYSYWANSKDDTLEGVIVRVSDMLHVIKKVIDEVCFLKNMHMLRVSMEVVDHLVMLQKRIASFSISKESQDILSDLIKEGINILNDINERHEQFFAHYNIVNHKTVKSWK